MTSFREIEHGSPDYHGACRLRHEVLRVPLGLDLYAEDLAAEAGQRHYGLFDETGALLACVSAVPEPPDGAKIRQMAVSPAHQGKGLGRLIMQEAERRLAALGLVRLHLHARATVAGFYETLGYVRSGPGFIEVGIPHVSMAKVVA